MSSATPQKYPRVRKFLASLGSKGGTVAEALKTIRRLGVNPRQQELLYFWGHYRATNYEGRKIAWDGRKHVPPVEVEQIASQGVLPQGFERADSLPVRFRRPTAPYRLPRVITDRFTGLLFSERMAPQIRLDASPALQALIDDFLEQSRWWSMWSQARAFGGGMGSACVAFQFVRGTLRLQALNPIWTEPELASDGSVKSLEIRWVFPVEERQPDGTLKEVAYWYRRTLDERSDVIYKPAPVGDGRKEPEWVVERSVDHGFGFCPAVWVQNVPNPDAVDGDPDCYGAYELVEAMDALLAQAHKGLLNNCDPTPVLKTGLSPGEIMLGSGTQEQGNMLRVEAGGDAKFLEINAAGIEAAGGRVEAYRTMILEICQCVLDSPRSDGTRTATEIDRRYAMMLARAEVLREQYGDAMKRLLELILTAVDSLLGLRTEPSGELTRREIRLPEARLRELGMDPDAQAVLDEIRAVGPSSHLVLRWPRFFQPSVQDVLTATQAAALAKTSSLLDTATLVGFLAEYYDVEDTEAILEKLSAETSARAEVAAAQQAALDASALAGVGFRSLGPPPIPTDEDDDE